MNLDLLAGYNELDDTPISREDFLRAPFSYVGAKSRTVENIVSKLPVTDTWIDCFGGSGTVTLARRPSRFEVFNDRHAGIVSFYRCIRDRQKRDALVERLSLTVHSREEFIWSIETWDHDELDDVERAARWYYSIIYSFGRVGRNFGRSLEPKVIFSGCLHEKIPLFHGIHERFKNVQVENADWRTMFRDYDSPTAVWYLDPPYYAKNVYKHNMSKADHIEMCQKIFSLKGFVALSGYDNEVYDKFPWDEKYSWPLRLSVTTKAIKTDTSNVLEIGSDEALDNLWIKDFSE